MAIEISQAEETPQLVYNRIILCDLHMNQRLNAVDSYPPYYTLKIEIRRYAVDSEGKRHYSPSTDILSIDDYATVAMTKAQQGDMDLANAASAIEAALAKIVADQKPEFGTTQVV
jgi:hypothetical protein